MSANRAEKSTELNEIDEIMNCPPQEKEIEALETEGGANVIESFRKYVSLRENNTVAVQMPDGELHVGILKVEDDQYTLRCVVTRNVADVWNKNSDLPFTFEAITFIGDLDSSSVEQYFEARFGLPVETDQVWMN